MCRLVPYANGNQAISAVLISVCTDIHKYIEINMHRNRGPDTCQKKHTQNYSITGINKKCFIDFF